MQTAAATRDDRGPRRDLASRILQMGRSLDSIHHELVRTLAAFDESGEWARDGHHTCSAWVAENLRVAMGTAREWLRVGHALEDLPTIERSFREGRLSYAQVRTLTRIAVDHPDRDAELCDLAEGTPARELARRLARWSTDNEDQDELDRRHQRQTGLFAQVQPDGMGLITLRLPPAEYGTVMAAIDARVMAQPQGSDSSKSGDVGGDASADAPETGRPKRPSLAHQRARALVGLITDGGSEVVTEVILHVRGDGNTLHDGTPVSDNVVASKLPESFLRTMIHDAESRPINVSGRHRYPTKRQRLVVDEREPRCRCGSDALLEKHHEPPFEESRRTVVDELENRCPRCHRKRHGRS